MFVLGMQYKSYAFAFTTFIFIWIFSDINRQAECCCFVWLYLRHLPVINGNLNQDDLFKRFGPDRGKKVAITKLSDTLDHNLFKNK